MQNYDNEPFLNEDYWVATVADGATTRVCFNRLTANYVGFPYPKDNAIRYFHREARRLMLDGNVAVQLWRCTPKLVLCAESRYGQISVLPKS